jgi:hypothetical protein
VECVPDFGALARLSLASHCTRAIHPPSLDPTCEQGQGQGESIHWYHHIASRHSFFGSLPCNNLYCNPGTFLARCIAIILLRPLRPAAHSPGIKDLSLSTINTTITGRPTVALQPIRGIIRLAYNADVVTARQTVPETKHDRSRSVLSPATCSFPASRYTSRHASHTTGHRSNSVQPRHPFQPKARRVNTTRRSYRLQASTGQSRGKSNGPGWICKTEQKGGRSHAVG